MGLSPIKSIRQKCLDCSAGQHKEIRECPILECPLYLFRMGKNPNRKGKGNPSAFNQNSAIESDKI